MLESVHVEAEVAGGFAFGKRWRVNLRKACNSGYGGCWRRCGEDVLAKGMQQQLQEVVGGCCRLLEEGQLRSRGKPRKQ